MKKRIISMMLSVVMVLTMLPAVGMTASAEEVVVPEQSENAGWDAGTGVHTVIGTEGAPSGSNPIDLEEGATLDLRSSAEETVKNGNNSVVYRGKKTLTIIGDPDKTYSFCGYPYGSRWAYSGFYMTEDDAVVTLVNFKWRDFTDHFTIMSSKVRKITIRYQGECELPELYDRPEYVFEPVDDTSDPQQSRKQLQAADRPSERDAGAEPGGNAETADTGQA